MITKRTLRDAAKQATSATITATCGHPTKIPLKPAEFFAARRDKALAKACPECRKASHEILLKKQREARRKKLVEAAARGKLPKGRLPDGAEFHVRYDAMEEQWSGTLKVSGQMFACKWHALFGMLAKLDGFYRTWAATQVAEE
jgi:ssDNA-binding Zn-finger/Zn-ribbon topoisomerase 1